MCHTLGTGRAKTEPCNTAKDRGKEMGQGECQSGKKSHLGEMKPRSSFILSDSELSEVSCAPQGSIGDRGGSTAFSNASHGPQWASL